MGLLFCGSGWSQQATESEERDPQATAVWIDDEPVIRWGEVDQLVRSQVDPDRLTPGLRQVMRSQAQESLLGRRLILLHLQRAGQLPTDRDVELHTEDLRTRVQARGIDWQTHLSDLGVTAEEFAESVRFSIGWRQVLEQRLTDENLQRFFDEHHRDYDGTELEVSQIVRVTSESTTDEQRQRLMEELSALRARIEAGELGFAEAARQFSDGGTAQEGGSLGRLARHSAMPESFSRAAFELEAGEMSPVFATSLGVHLIRCDAVHGGQAVLADVKDQVRRDATVYLFDWYVDQEADHHTIRFDEP